MVLQIKTYPWIFPVEVNSIQIVLVEEVCHVVCESVTVLLASRLAQQVIGRWVG